MSGRVADSIPAPPPMQAQPHTLTRELKYYMYLDNSIGYTNTRDTSLLTCRASAREPKIKVKGDSGFRKIKPPKH